MCNSCSKKTISACLCILANVGLAANAFGASSPADKHWQAGFTVPGVAGEVYAIAVGDAGEVYVGGFFNAVGLVPANNIAKWDGSSWSALGAGISVDGSLVGALAVSGSDV
jgi:hypothetical protein